MNVGAELAMIDAVCAQIPEPASGRSHAEEILHRYREVDAKLVAAGFPPTSPWWLETIERWYRSGCQEAVLRVGRRGGKSSTLSRVAVVEALYGHHVESRGEIAYVAIVSTDRPEAYGRLRNVEEVLDALGVAYRPCAGGAIGIEIIGLRRGFRVFTASIKGVSGFTAIFVLCDEVAKWADNDTGANPATEVIASIKPTMMTQANARMVLSSSPMGMLDAHYDAFERGETGAQIIASAPTWVANPTISEAKTHEREPDERKWAREYACVPMAEAETSLLTEACVERARRDSPLHLPPEPGHRYSAAMDPATRGHAWTLCVATKGVDGIRRICHAQEWRGSVALPLRPSAVLAEIRDILAVYGLRWVVTDQHAADHLRDSAPAGLTLIEAPWTASTKTQAYEHVAKLLQDELLELHPDPAVKADLLGIRRRLTRAGVSYELAEVKGRHSDYAPALALAVDDARFAAVAAAPTLTTQQAAEAKKVAFLEGRRRDREREERYGKRPATHRRFG